MAPRQTPGRTDDEAALSARALAQLLDLVPEFLGPSPSFARYGELMYQLQRQRARLASAGNDEENIVGVEDGKSESDASLDEWLGPDDNPDEYESEGINDGDPDMDREEEQSADDELDSNGSEGDAMKETRYQNRDGDFEEEIESTASDGDISASSGSEEGGHQREKSKTSP